MNSKPFAKIFDTEKYGQVLVRIGTDDDGNPCICMTVSCMGIFVTSTSSYEIDVDGDKLQKTFDEISIDYAEKFANEISEMLSEEE